MSVPRARLDAAQASWLRRTLGPELVALLLIAGLVGSTAALSMPSGPDGPDPSPLPSVAPTATSRPSAAPDLSLLRLAVQLDGRIAESGAALRAEVESPTLDTVAVASHLRQIASNTAIGVDLARRIAASPGLASLGDGLAAYYRTVREIAIGGLSASLLNEPAYRTAANDMIATIGSAASLEAELLAALGGTGAPPSGSPSPDESASPGAIASPSPSPSPAPTAPASPELSSAPGPSEEASPSASPSTGPTVINQLRNPGFEAGLANWELVLRDDSAQAALSVDRVAAWAGGGSARVDIAAGTGSRSAIALRQGGVPVQAGIRYVCRVVVRATGPRDLRLAVVSSGGAAYGTRIFAVSEGWTELRFEFTALVSDPEAFVELDLGRSEEGVWVDDAAFGPAPAGLAP